MGVTGVGTTGARGLTRTSPGLLAGNFLLLAGGEGLAKLTLFLAFTHIGRTLGAGRYGGLEFTLASMVFFTLPVDLGLGVYGAREAARSPSRAHTLLTDVIRLRTLLLALSIGALLLYVLAIPKPPEIKQLLLLYGVSLVALPFHLQWFFQGHDEMGWVAAASIVRSAVFASLVLLLLRPESPLLLIGYFECAAVGSVAVFCLLVRRFRFPTPATAEKHSWRESLVHLKEAAPIGAVELTWAFLWYITTVLLGLMVADDSLGWFGASHRILMALHTFVWMYFFNLLPSISRTRNSPPEELAGLLGRSIRLTAWAGYFVALLVATTAGLLLTTIYGDDFAPGGPLLATLVWIIPVALLSGHYRFSLIAYNLQHWHLYATAASAATVVLLSLALTPRMGALGTARAFLFGCVLELLLVYWCVCRSVVKAGFIRSHSRPALTLGGAVLLFFWFAQGPVILRAALAAGAYLAVALLLERREIGGLIRLATARVQT